MTLGEDVQVERKSEHTEVSCCSSSRPRGNWCCSHSLVTVAQQEMGARFVRTDPAVGLSTQSKLIAGVTIISFKVHLEILPDAAPALLSP